MPAMNADIFTINTRIAVTDYVKARKASASPAAVVPMKSNIPRKKDEPLIKFTSQQFNKNDLHRRWRQQPTIIAVTDINPPVTELRGSVNTGRREKHHFIDHDRLSTTIATVTAQSLANSSIT
ncbi:hypothetical protein BC829DRAFT_442511 [Chytridium lagenaria]|nr:hypothetical protein BC829DRAFT_442511 [Chytridium lagenaria]